MKKKHKTIFKCVCGILTACLVVLAAGGWWLFGSFLKAANSIEQLEDGLYAMEYSGDDGFDDFLARGGAASDRGVADYLASFFPTASTRWKAMCRPGSLAAPPSAPRTNTAPSFSGAITTGRSAGP